MDIRLIVPRDGKSPTAMHVNGRVITLSEFPPVDTTRWVIRKKYILAAAVISGLKTPEELATLYKDLTHSELMSWVRTLRESGYASLRQTHVQELSQHIAENSLPVPIETFVAASADDLTLTSDGTMRNEAGITIRFTKLQTRMLGYLMLNPGVVVSKLALLRIMYPNGIQPEQKIVDVVICAIRKKIKKGFGHELIETSWGRGYVIRKKW